MQLVVRAGLEPARLSDKTAAMSIWSDKSFKQ